MLQAAPRLAICFTDCVDTGEERGNAYARMATAIMRELGATTDFVPLGYPNGAAGAALTFVDVLAQCQPSSELAPLGQTIILGNPAPRAQTHGVWPNGRPVCWANIQGTYVITTFAPEFFALAHRLGLVSAVNLLDTEVVLAWAVAEGLVRPDQAKRMNSQFRGASLIPWLARLIALQQYDVPCQAHDLGLPQQPQGIVARIDTEDFGNCFLDVLPRDVGFRPGRELLLADDQPVRCYARLADIPPGELGITIGSSGWGDDHFLMVAVQGGRAAKRLQALGPIERDVLKAGDQLLHPDMVRGRLVRS
jgi:hypothetical protein